MDLKQLVLDFVGPDWTLDTLTIAGTAHPHRLRLTADLHHASTGEPRRLTLLVPAGQDLTPGTAFCAGCDYTAAECQCDAGAGLAPG